MKELLSILDSRLDLWVSEHLNALPGPIPEDMATGETSDDWNFWVPVPSLVTAESLLEIEAQLAVALSPQYKALLQHKHFMELNVGDVHFFPHPTVGWRELLLRETLQNYGFLLERSFLPFAVFSDWGLWCFSVEEPDPNGEYSIHQWDHDRPDEMVFVGETLLDALRVQDGQART